MLPRIMSLRNAAAIALCAALLVSCGSDAGTEEAPLAEAYILVVDWVLAEPEFAVEVAPDKLVVVFVESMGPAEIDLDVQVKVIAHFSDKAEIRFIDTRTEALQEADGFPVREGGLLLGLGGVPLDGSWDVRGEIYQTAERVVGYRFKIDRSGNTPSMTQPPERVEPEGLVADS